MARKHLLWIWKFQCYSDRIDGMQRQELEVLERMMGNENTNQMNFFSEMSEYQITAREFFSTVLLDSLYRNFGFNDILISYFDTHGNFLSWTN